jgi:hypothetical protein
LEDDNNDNKYTSQSYLGQGKVKVVKRVLFWLYLSLSMSVGVLRSRQDVDWARCTAEGGTPHATATPLASLLSSSSQLSARWPSYKNIQNSQHETLNELQYEEIDCEG